MKVARGLMVRATILTAAYWLAHVAGLRQYTALLTGTSPTGSAVGWPAAVLGCGYLVLYFAWVLAVPILVLAAVILSIRVWRSARG